MTDSSDEHCVIILVVSYHFKINRFSYEPLAKTYTP